MNQDIEQLKYPLGRYQPSEDISPAQLAAWVEELATFPSHLRAVAEGLSEEQLDTPYRPEGWTLRQVIHHLADSHMNAYIRFKLAVTEEHPIIKPYSEKLWAECAEGASGPIVVSLDLLEALHWRWVLFLKTLSPADFERTYFNPEQQKIAALKNVLGVYAWHGAHHLAHITETQKRKAWL
ncbi:MAG: YfiT family bacillithiol transferase [Sphingobacteriaceae bacterium]